MSPCDVYWPIVMFNTSLWMQEEICSHSSSKSKLEMKFGVISFTLHYMDTDVIEAKV